MTFVYADAEGFLAKIKGAWQHYLSKDKTAEYRKMALLGSLPKWNGFGVVDEEIQQMTATEAIEELDHVMYCLSGVLIEEYHNYRKKQPSQFDARKVNGSTFVMDCFFLWQPKHATGTKYCHRIRSFILFVCNVFFFSAIYPTACTLLRRYQEVSSSSVYEL